MAQWITETVDQLGYTSIFLLMLAENVVPPIPSELVMPAGGFAAHHGKMTFWGVVLAGTAGALAGTSLWYGLARWIGSAKLRHFIEKYGGWLLLSVADIDKSNAWFQRHGRWAVLVGRWVPGVRTLISVPAGFAEMNFLLFLAYSAIGTISWNVLLASLGWLLRDQYRVVGDYLGWITLLVLAGFVVWFVVRWIRRNEG